MTAALLRRLSAQIDPDRLAERTLRLVSIDSPSGREAPVADAYEAMLREAGLDVALDREFEESPSVIARLEGASAGRTLQLAGHLDTVSSAHAPPAIVGGNVHGRGACDMKGGLAVLVEVAAALATARSQWPGSLLVTAYGQHEEVVAPRDLHAPLVGLLRRGVHGDACIIPEGPHRELPLAGRGLVIFRIWFRRPGPAVHEVLAGDVPPPNPIMAALDFCARLERRSRDWTVTHPVAGSESYFVGALRGGDLYNRIPAVAEVWGTRRYPTGRTREEVVAELEAVATEAGDALGVEVELSIAPSGQPFSIASDEPIAGAVARAHELVVRAPLPCAGLAYTGDVSHFVNVAGVPAIYHGTDQTTAHGDHESVAVDDLVRCANVLLAAALGFLSPD